MPNLTDLLLPALEGHLAEALTTALRDYAHGAAEDLQLYGLRVAKEAIAAGISGDPHAKAEVRAKALLMLELHRLKVAQASRAQVEQILDVLLNFGIKVASTALKSAVIP
jgi:hypothetical protein